MDSSRYNSPLVQIVFCCITILSITSQSWALAKTDSLTWGGDYSRTGYQPFHNLDPKVVASPDFGQIFQTLLPGNFQGLAPEQIFSQPLVYTGADGVQYVYVSTTQNNLYKINAKTGAIVASRNLHVPFLQVELESCVDINPTIGITATGVIDADTGIWYITAKTYSEQFQNGKFSTSNPPGRLNGRYWQHAVHTEDLSEVAGWPIPLEGLPFRNNPNRLFLGGNQHSRPGALLVGDYLYTGYASHCVQYNFTGAIIGFHKKTGKVVEIFATEGGPEPNTVRGGGIWMSGGGLAYDGKGSMYFSTGNGYASQLKATGNAVPGRSPPSSLEEAAVNAKINEDGTITIVDFFMPMEKNDLDGADKDLGTSPLQLLPSDVYSCPNHPRIGIVTGKSGKTYWLNLDSLGGYQQAPNAQDAVIQTYQNENSVWAGAGVMPLGGGYVYIPVTQYTVPVFRFTCDSNGNAVFIKVSATADKNAYILGTSSGGTTSLEGQAGTGLLWLSDVQGNGLRIYDPIPPADGGPLRSLRNFTIPGVTKFSRPAFGDGRVYVSTTTGYLYGFGSPFNNPLNCSAPNDFGSIDINSTSDPINVTCVANVDTAIASISLLNTKNFKVSQLPILPLKLFKGQKFDFRANSNPSTIGTLISDVTIIVNNVQAGFSSRSLVTLKATSRSKAAILSISPETINFNVIAGQPGTTQSFLLANLGETLLTITNVSFSFISTDGPWIQSNTTSNGLLQIGDFTFTLFPNTIQPAASVSNGVSYAPSVSGNSTIYVRAFSDGGSDSLQITGVAGSQPKAVIEFQTIDGTGWIPYSNLRQFDFGTVFQAQTKNLRLRITNGGGPNAVPLAITISKPPYGVPGIIGKSNVIDLAEGQSISAGKSLSANLYCSVPKAQVNQPSYNGSTVWVLNTGDPNLGKQTIQFTCTAATQQVGPLLSNGTAQFGYVGCFQEYAPGRQLAQQAYSDQKNNTNDKCISTCLDLGYIFAGTEYQQECWCGNAIPISKQDESNCNYGCTGSASQSCGGNGIFKNASFISLLADSKRFAGYTTPLSLQIPSRFGQYDFIGCYAEPGGKTLSANSTRSNVMTVDTCGTFCAGSKYFGLEFSAECYCGSALLSASTVVDPAQCNMPCKGSNSQFCGGSGRMQIYQINSTVASSTSTTSMASASTAVIGTTTTNTSTSSIVTKTSSPLLSNTESTTTTTPILSSSTATGPLKSTSVVSASSNTAPLVPSSTKISATTISSTTSTTSTSAPSNPPLGSYNFAGCWTDSVGARVLTGPSIANPTMTPLVCASFCSQYAYFGLEYGAECWCGPRPKNSTQMPISDCNMPCSGDSSLICGSANRLSLYFSSDPQKAASDPVVPGPTIGNYTYASCFIDSANPRLLDYVFAADNMTNAVCLQIAEAGQYAYAGLEYGRECWLGNTLNGLKLPNGGGPNGKAANSECASTCSGSRKEICGGGLRANLWLRNAAR